MTENVPAESLRVGDRIHYRGYELTVIGEREPLDNLFGLPWFKYEVQTDDGRTVYARFGPGGTVPRCIESREGAA